MRALLLAAGAIVVVASPAFAADAAKIDKVKPDTGLPGRSVMIMGSGFPDKPEGVEITLADIPCQVTGVTPTLINLIMPVSPVPPPGAQKLKIKLKGGETLLTTWKVIDIKDKKAVEKQREQDAIDEGGGSTLPPPDPTSFLKITKFVVNPGDSSFSIEGESTLSTEFYFHVQLGFVAGNQDVNFGEAKKITVTPKWSTRFGPFSGKTLLAGRYFVKVKFEYHQQSNFAKNKSGSAKMDPKKREDQEIVNVSRYEDIGNDQQKVKDEQELKAHYAGHLKGSSDAIEQLEKARLAAGKCYFKKPSGGVDEDGWIEWVKQHGVTGEDEIKKLKLDGRFLRSIHFNPDSWKDWIEKQFLPTLKAIKDKHSGWQDNRIGTRDEQLQAEADAIINLVIRLTQQYTFELFERSKLEVPQSLRNPLGIDSAGGGSITSKGEFDNRKAMLAARLKLDEKPAKNDKK